MTPIRIIHKNVNLEILTKLLNSVAKKYGCSVDYSSEDNRIRFSGDVDCCRHVTEETLAFFPNMNHKSALAIKCPVIEGR